VLLVHAGLEQVGEQALELAADQRHLDLDLALERLGRAATGLGPEDLGLIYLTDSPKDAVDFIIKTCTSPDEKKGSGTDG
jgi:hypothetical protein